MKKKAIYLVLFFPIFISGCVFSNKGVIDKKQYLPQNNSTKPNPAKVINKISTSSKDSIANSSAEISNITYDESDWVGAKPVFEAKGYDYADWERYEDKNNGVVIMHKKDWVIADLGDLFVGPKGWKISYEYGEKKILGIFSISSKIYESQIDIADIIEEIDKGRELKKSYVIFKEKKSILLSDDKGRVEIVTPVKNQIITFTTYRIDSEVEMALGGVNFVD